MDVSGDDGRWHSRMGVVKNRAKFDKKNASLIIAKCKTREFNVRDYVPTYFYTYITLSAQNTAFAM